MYNPTQDEMSIGSNGGQQTIFQQPPPVPDEGPTSSQDEVPINTNDNNCSASNDTVPTSVSVPAPAPAPAPSQPTDSSDETPMDVDVNDDDNNNNAIAPALAPVSTPRGQEIQKSVLLGSPSVNARSRAQENSIALFRPEDYSHMPNQQSPPSYENCPETSFSYAQAPSANNNNNNSTNNNNNNNNSSNRRGDLDPREIGDIKAALKAKRGEYAAIDAEFSYIFAFSKLLFLINKELKYKLAAGAGPILGAELITELAELLMPFPITSLIEECDRLIRYDGADTYQFFARYHSLERMYGTLLPKRGCDSGRSIMFTECVAGLLQAVQKASLLVDPEESKAVDFVTERMGRKGVATNEKEAFVNFFVLHNKVVSRLVLESGCSHSGSRASAERKLHMKAFENVDGRRLVVWESSKVKPNVVEKALGCPHFCTLRLPSGSTRYTVLLPPSEGGDTADDNNNNSNRNVGIVLSKNGTVRNVGEFEMFIRSFTDSKQGAAKLRECVGELRRNGVVLWYTAVPRHGEIVLLYAAEKNNSGKGGVPVDDAVSLLAERLIGDDEDGSNNNNNSDGGGDNIIIKGDTFDDVVVCPAGTRCTQVTDSAHMAKYWHPTGNLSLCEASPFLCSAPSNEEHAKERMHICMQLCISGSCGLTDDPTHTANYIHPPCLAVCECNEANDIAHMAEFHGKTAIELCSKGSACPRVNDHIEAYHPKPALLPCAGINLHSGRRTPHFAENVARWTKQTAAFLKAHGCPDAKTVPAYPAIVRWVRNFRPVHQCPTSVLLSIVRTGAVTSLVTLSQAWNDKTLAAHLVMLATPKARAAVAGLADTNGGCVEDARKALHEYLMWQCRAVTSKRGPADYKRVSDMVLQGVPIESLNFAMSVLRSTKPMSESEQQAAQAAAKRAAKAGVAQEMLRAVRGWVEAWAEQLVQTLEGVKALNFDVDKTIGTDRTVFAIHGPNMGKYGDAEVAIVFHEQAACHPDTFLTPVAAMGYYQGWYVKNSSVGTDRPWAGEAKPWNRGAQDEYEYSKFHHVTQGWAEAEALELVARVVQNGTRKAPADVTLEDVQRLWHDSDPHTAIEAHLPGVVPLSYIEKVFILNSALTHDDAADAERALAELGIVVERVADTREAVFDLFAKQPYAHAAPHMMIPTGYTFATSPSELQSIPASIFVQEGGVLLPAVMQFVAVSAEPAHVVDLSIAFKSASGKPLAKAVLPPRVGAALSIETPSGSAPAASLKVAGALPPTNNVRVRVVVDGCQASVDVLGPVGVQAAARWCFSSPPAAIAIGSQVLETTVWNFTLTRVPKAQLHRVDIASIPERTAETGSPSSLPQQSSSSSSSPQLSMERGSPGLSAAAAQPSQQQQQQQNEYITFKDTKVPVVRKLSKPLCKTQINCSKDKDPKHMKEYAHICQYGVTCDHFDEKEHQEEYYHIKKPVCEVKDCPRMYDPVHRATYNHKKHWDCMIKCRDYPKCTKKHQNYYHDSKDYKPYYEPDPKV